MTHTWMARLATHYEKIRAGYPEDKLLILFDIDGTILDMRYMVQHVLKRYDDAHGTRHFSRLKLEDITVHENQIDALLHHLGIDPAEYEGIKSWFEREAWQSPAMLEAHRPFAGVLEVIRWFQLQPYTEVGLNTGRLETARAATLRSLNQLGREYKAEFTDPLLYMNPNSWAEPVTVAKISGIRYFQAMGYRIVAFIDNEPANLQAVAQIDPHHDILLLHADTIFQSSYQHLPPHAVTGTHYNLTELVSERSLPRHINFVWQNINNGTNLVQFLASNVFWGEFSVRTTADFDPKNGHGIFNLNLPDLDLLLLRLSQRNKGIKFNLHKNGYLAHRLLEIVANHNLSSVWFNVEVDALREQDFLRLVKACPEAIVQIPIDFLAPMIGRGDLEARDILQMYNRWGISRFGVNWRAPNARAVVHQLDSWGFEVDIYNVGNLETFLQAVLLMPVSITSSFNFPQWSYYGLMSGEYSSLAVPSL